MAKSEGKHEGKSEGKIEKKTNGVPGVPDAETIKRKRLLARVAGQIAGGIVGAPSPATNSAAKVAEISVNIADAILEKIGL